VPTTANSLPSAPTTYAYNPTHEAYVTPDGESVIRRGCGVRAKILGCVVEKDNFRAIATISENFYLGVIDSGEGGDGMGMV